MEDNTNQNLETTVYVILLFHRVATYAVVIHMQPHSNVLPHPPLRYIHYSWRLNTLLACFFGLWEGTGKPGENQYRTYKLQADCISGVEGLSTQSTHIDESLLWTAPGRTSSAIYSGNCLRAIVHVIDAFIPDLFSGFSCVSLFAQSVFGQ